MLAVLSLTILLVAAQRVADAQVNRIVLRVNDEIATLYDYERLKREQLAALAQADLPEARKQEIAATLGEQTMRQLFEEMLLTSRAEQIGVFVSDDEVDSAMRSAMQSFGVESIEEFEAGLAQGGMTLAAYREQMRKTMVVRQVMGREIQSRIELVEEDLRRYYRTHSEDFRVPRRIELREIVVLDDANLDEADQRQIGESVATAIRDGSIDELLAETEAAGRTTGWIELGWVTGGDLDSQLEPVVASLGAGEVSEPTRARGGLHVLQALQVEESKLREFQEVRDQIEAIERDRLFEEESQSYIDELIASSYIESHPPPEAAGFEPVQGRQAAGPAMLETEMEEAEDGT